jgi:hypothetical protein
MLAMGEGLPARLVRTAASASISSPPIATREAGTKKFPGRLAAGGPSDYRYARTPGSPTLEERS